MNYGVLHGDGRARRQGPATAPADTGSRSSDNVHSADADSTPVNYYAGLRQTVILPAPVRGPDGVYTVVHGNITVNGTDMTPEAPWRFDEDE